jgi:hypothetical protein
MRKRQDARIFDVDTNFQQKARRPGGLTREKAIAHAQAKIDQCKPKFTEWLSAELPALQVAIRQAEESSGDPSAVDQALYHARQLRDVGSTMGFELVTFVADNLCDILEAIKSGARYDKDVVDCHLNALALATQKQYQHLTPAQLPELSGGLRRVFEKLRDLDSPDN